MSLPQEHRNQIKELTLFYTENGRRGLGGGGSIILRCLNVTDLELESVLIHEVGHLVDSGFLEGTTNGSLSGSGFYDFDTPVSENDPSVAFYRISWLSESTKKQSDSDLDFVSLYAETDPFEDFAETYAYYIVHGAEFRTLAKNNISLAEKYEFMKDSVFGGKEFGDVHREVQLDASVRKYDVTVLPVL